MMKSFLTFFLVTFLLFPLYAQQDVVKTPQGDIKIHPIQHGSLVLQWQGKTIYVDPYGDTSLYKDIPKADLILITDIHGDHYNPETLFNIPYQQANFVVPQAVADLLKKEKVKKDLIQVINNGEEKEIQSFKIEAIPMYNLPESPEARHTKGRGNGYVISSGGTRIYISGDTEDIPEMRKLQDIKVAFVCMNLPYTMPVEKAADAVLEFKPSIVYPYHYRGEGGKLSNVEVFKAIVEKNKDIEVRVRDWYRQQ